MFFKFTVLCTLVLYFSQEAVAPGHFEANCNGNAFKCECNCNNYALLNGLAGRVLQGQSVQLGQFPWQVFVNVMRDGKPYLCGGALISPEWVLTAAQCVHKATSFSVRLGTLKSSGTDEPSLQVIAGERGIYHPQYNSSVLNNDIALIKLAQKAQLNQYVQPIRLANTDDHLGPDTDVIVTDWGLARNAGSVSPVLNYASLKTITNEKCEKDYNSQIITNSTVCCKGITNEGICNGDTGSPLVRYTNDVAIHVGIFSFLGPKGCEDGVPSGYVRTASFRDWIRQNSGV